MDAATVSGAPGKVNDGVSWVRAARLEHLRTVRDTAKGGAGGRRLLVGSAKCYQVKRAEACKRRAVVPSGVIWVLMMLLYWA